MRRHLDGKNNTRYFGRYQTDICKDKGLEEKVERGGKMNENSETEGTPKNSDKEFVLFVLPWSPRNVNKGEIPYKKGVCRYTDRGRKGGPTAFSPE